MRRARWPYVLSIRSSPRTPEISPEPLSFRETGECRDAVVEEIKTASVSHAKRPPRQRLRPNGLVFRKTCLGPRSQLPIDPFRTGGRPCVRETLVFRTSQIAVARSFKVSQIRPSNPKGFSHAPGMPPWPSQRRGQGPGRRRARTALRPTFGAQRGDFRVYVSMRSAEPLSARLRGADSRGDSSEFPPERVRVYLARHHVSGLPEFPQHCTWWTVTVRPAGFLHVTGCSVRTLSFGSTQHLNRHSRHSAGFVGSAPR